MLYYTHNIFRSSIEKIYRTFNRFYKHNINLTVTYNEYKILKNVYLVENFKEQRYTEYI